MTAGTLGGELFQGDRRALARGITLVESTRADDRDAADALLTEVMPATGRAIRIGISGSPGAGKSTLIEALGLHVVESGHRVAVLAVDPSSSRTGGSILGDKTRMEELSRHPAAFVRPSPAGTTLGGVARRTREAMLLCEAAGFDVVIVETVGVGQSETAVADMVDCFVLLIAPAGGDELQGIKRGIVELADLVVVNKADGPLEAVATATASDYGAALHLVRPRFAGWTPRVVLVSALEQRGIDGLWNTITDFRTALDGEPLTERRAEQARAWMRDELADSLLDRLHADARTAAAAAALEAEVAAGRLAPTTAARRLIGVFLGDR
ncbi:MAG: methylmalonyl Co-A mutase-associated GTPase MeaB [Actinobacteria bacterium]|nr:methylmalonyl Co-A mutase-associated GTPase MeaB [Actinomycetota bacterium]